MARSRADAYPGHVRRLVLLLPALASLGAVGCVEPGSTCTLESSQIVMTTRAIDTQMSWRVEVVLEKAGDFEEPLTICDEDDSLTINGVEATEEITYGVARYIAMLGPDEQTVEVTYDRNNGDAFTATVETPAPFMITNPDPGSSVSRGADTEIRWSPAGPESTELAVELRADDVLCLEEWTELVPDIGSFTLPGGEVMLGPSAMSDGTMECDANLELTRASVGEVEAGLSASSSIEAYRKRVHRIRSVP